MSSSSSSLNDNRFCLGFLSFFFFVLASFSSVEFSGTLSVFRLTGFLKIILPSAGSNSSDYVLIKEKKLVLHRLTNNFPQTLNAKLLFMDILVVNTFI